MASLPPIVHVAGSGNIGNQMFKAMTALTVHSQVEGSRLANINLPEWNLVYPPIPHGPGHTERHPPNRIMDIDVASIIRRMRSGELHRVDIENYAQHLNNLRTPDFYRPIFPDTAHTPELPLDCLLINIRGGEVLDARHPDYVLLPLEYYAEIIAETGLRPVFMGQLEPNPYTNRLRARFPGAGFIPSMGQMADFALIRRARNIIVSVSTFSWLAAWLSHAERIFLPVNGFYSAAQHPEIDLLPLDDARYHFTQFPVNYAVPVADHLPVHAALNGTWRNITPAELRIIRARVSTSAPNAASYLEAFDETAYRTIYPDIDAAIRNGALSSGWDHYQHTGIIEGRTPFHFDRIHYAAQHIDAAIAVAQGHYADLLHHYLEVGRPAGYTANPHDG